MKTTYLLAVLLMFVFQACETPNTQTIQLVIGTYTNKSSEGIYTVDFDLESGDLTNKKLLYRIDDPTFQQFDPENKMLYSIGKRDGINYLQIFKQSKNLNFVLHDSISTTQKGICHIAYNKFLQLAVASNYTSGSITQASFNNEFNFETTKTEKHFGNGPKQSRQEAPHAHSVSFHENIAYASDLGADKIYIYQQENSYLQKRDSIATQAGAGPRHLTFSPNGNLMAVLNELASNVTLYQKDKDNFFTIPVQTISTLPDTTTQFSKAADIHYSPDGRFLYASNRGFNSIAVFKQSPNNLKLVEIETEGCKWIRNFTIAPNGNYLIAANRYGNNLTVYSIDQTTGSLKLTDKIIEINQPVCVTLVN